MIRTPQLMLLALSALFFSACSGNRTPPKPERPTPKVEFSATLTGTDSPFTADISTKKDRFRLVGESLVYLGSLETEGEILVLDPESKRYLRVHRDRRTKLFETHDRSAANRYETAANTTSARAFREAVLGPFRSPCQVATTSAYGHQECQMTPAGENLEEWTHLGKGTHISRDRGIKKTSSRHKLQFNTKFGVVTATNVGFDRTFQDIEEKSFPPEHFEVPTDYLEALSDEELDEPSLGLLGGSDMLVDFTLRGFADSGVDHPAAPLPREWFYQSESWWDASDTSQMTPEISLERVVFDTAFNPDELPFNLNYKFQVEKWDEKPEYGDRSFRESPYSVIFFADNQLFRVRTPDEYIDDQPALCEYLVRAYVKSPK